MKLRTSEGKEWWRETFNPSEEAESRCSKKNKHKDRKRTRGALEFRLSAAGDDPEKTIGTHSCWN